MSASRSVLSDDNLWLFHGFGYFDRSDPQQWKREVEMYLEEHDEAAEESSPSGPRLVANELKSKRKRRRKIQRRRLRGVRPTDEVELRTSKWFRREKKKRQPMVKCTATLPLRTREGKIEMRTRRRRYAPAPNRRLALVPPIEIVPESEPDESFDTATTIIVKEAKVTDVILEKSPVDEVDRAVVVVTEEEVEVLEEVEVTDLDLDAPDREILSVIFDGDIPEQWDCCSLPECTQATHYEPYMPLPA